MGNSQCATAPNDAFWEVNVKNWTPQHVHSWLLTIDKDLKSVANIFKKNKIKGCDLIEFDKNENQTMFQSMNIPIGHRMVLMKEIHKLVLNNNHNNNNNINNNNDDNNNTMPQLHLTPSHTNKLNNNNNNNIENESQNKINVQLNPMNSNKIHLNDYQQQNRTQNMINNVHHKMNQSMTVEYNAYNADIDTTEPYDEDNNNINHLTFNGYDDSINQSDDKQQDINNHNNDDDDDGEYHFNDYNDHEQQEEDSYFKNNNNTNSLYDENSQQSRRRLPSQPQLSHNQHSHNQHSQQRPNVTRNNSDLSQPTTKLNLDGNRSNNRSNKSKKTPSLSLRQSLSKIKDLKDVFRHSHNGSGGDFVILETPSSSSSNRTPLPLNQSNQWTVKKPPYGDFGDGQDEVDHDDDDDDDDNDVMTNQYNIHHPPGSFPVGRPMLANMRSNTPLKKRGINDNDRNYWGWRQDAGDDITNYYHNENNKNGISGISIKHKNNNNEESKNDEKDNNNNNGDNDDDNKYGHDDDDPSDYFNEDYNYMTDSDVSYPSAIAKLTKCHTKTLFMLETTKKYLLNGYLREHGILKIIDGIEKVITSYFDDSAMCFDIKINDLFKKSDGYNKLHGREFEFNLGMDHKIELRPTLTHKIKYNDNYIKFNVMELSLECEALPIKIDKCNVLINILCICHEIKYQKIDIYSFGTDLLGDSNDFTNYNLLNKSGLLLIIPYNDMENLHDLKFEINATILDIEYDPNYEHYGIIPRYNETLKMSNNISFIWKLNDRILKIMYNDIFKQKFYSSHFDFEHWCLSCYKHDDGQLIICLNLLRLQSKYQSIDCQSVISLKNNKQIIWSENTNLHCDIQYNNSFKWKLNTESTNKLFKIITNNNNNNNTHNHDISINIQINIIKKNKKQSKLQNDIYNNWLENDMENY